MMVECRAVDGFLRAASRSGSGVLRPVVLLVVGMTAVIAASCSGSGEAKPGQLPRVGDALASVVVTTRFDDGMCLGDGTSRAVVSGQNVEGRGIDLDEDRVADVLLRNDAMFFSADALPDIRTAGRWVRVDFPSEEQFGTPHPFDLAAASELGLISGPIRTDGNAILKRAMDAAKEGLQPPTRIRTGMTEPDAPKNATLSWETGPDDTIIAASITYDDERAGGGVVTESAEVSDRVVAMPGDLDEVVPVGDLLAIDLVRTTARWTGCLTGEPAPTAAQLECAASIVGEATVAEWVAQRESAASVFPVECPT